MAADEQREAFGPALGAAKPPAMAAEVHGRAGKADWPFTRAVHHEGVVVVFNTQEWGRPAADLESVSMDQGDGRQRRGGPLATVPALQRIL